MEQNYNLMNTAPRNNTIVRLLVKFTFGSFEDNDEPCWTIGSNGFDDSNIDEWQFAGWSWSHGCFTEGEGTPIGWLPLIDNNINLENENKILKSALNVAARRLGSSVRSLAEEGDEWAKETIAILESLKN